MEGALNRKIVSCKSYYMCKGFLGLGCWPGSPPLAWSAWKCGEQKLGSRQKEVWAKDGEGEKETGDIRRRDPSLGLYAGFLLLANAPTRVKPSYATITFSAAPLNWLTNHPQNTSFPLPVSSEGEIFVESVWLENNVCCSSLPGPCRDKQDCGHFLGDTERSRTNTHIDTIIIHQMPISSGMRGQRAVQIWGCSPRGCAWKFDMQQTCRSHSLASYYKCKFLR